jgi:hypothetical protein
MIQGNNRPSYLLAAGYLSWFLYTFVFTGALCFGAGFTGDYPAERSELGGIFFVKLALLSKVNQKNIVQI